MNEQKITATSLFNSPEMNAARKQYADRISAPILRPNGPNSVKLQNTLRLGVQLRDGAAWQYPILGGAVQVFQELASSREWVMSGPPRKVPNAIEWLQNTQSINQYTGLVDYGFQGFLQRRALDHIFLGMKAAICERRDSGTAPLEYADPYLLQFNRRNDLRDRHGVVNPVKPNERVWTYAGGRVLRADNVNTHYPFPIGSHLFISPIMYLLPTAILAWLIREADTASVDGRKLRDIYVVANPSLEATLREAIEAQVALWSGAEPEKVGIPVVAVNYAGSTPVKDLFARLGLSEIPPTFNREEFIFYYVNEISAALGLALRHFWNNERTTNKALEQVQEQRQQQKGPAVFVRNEQRMINQSGFLSQFDSNGRSVRFSFIEETDASSMKDRATVMKMFAEALEKVASVFGASIDAQSYVAWMQSEGVLPNELKLIDANTDLMMQNPDAQTKDPEDATGESDPKPTTMPESHDEPTSSAVEKSLDYGEIVMNSSGVVLAHRKKSYTLQDIVRNSIKTDMQRNWLDPQPSTFEEEEIEKPAKNIDDLVVDAISESEKRHRELVRTCAATKSHLIDEWVSGQKDFSDKDLVSEALHKCLHFQEDILTNDEQEAIDMIALHLEEFWDDSSY